MRSTETPHRDSFPTQLVNSTSSSSASSPGGTFVISQGGAATGQIGDVRVGGNATNFTTFVTEDPLNAAAAEGQLDAKISNFYIGGQTNNVLLVAPSGSRNISFGLGMDNVTINSLAISSLQANRDAPQLERHRSAVRSATCSSAATWQNTNVNVGESQSLFTFVNLPRRRPSAQPAPASSSATPPPTITNPRVNPVNRIRRSPSPRMAEP